MVDRYSPVELPKYLDVLLLINDFDDRTRIVRSLDRSESYVVKALDALVGYGCITVTPVAKDSKFVTIALTTKGKDVKRLVSRLLSRLDVKVMYGWCT